MQVKLLRVLQEGEFEPVGSSKTDKVGVRIIAATNRDLLQMVQEGHFREDLYYRLHVFPLKVPPLRKRDNDIILLASAFAEKYAQRMGRRAHYITPQQIAHLKSYNWPGNVRELQNVIVRALEATDWKVAGESGAANLLDVPPSTLSSRMKALGIRRPKN